MFFSTGIRLPLDVLNACFTQEEYFNHYTSTYIDISTPRSYGISNSWEPPFLACGGLKFN